MGNVISNAPSGERGFTTNYTDDGVTQYFDGMNDEDAMSETIKFPEPFTLNNIESKKHEGVEDLKYKKKVTKLLKQVFICPEDGERWISGFTDPGYQVCPKCHKKDIQGKIRIPDGFFLKCLVECTGCNLKFARPMETPKKRIRCLNCRGVCSVITFSLEAGDFEEAKVKWKNDVGKKKKEPNFGKKKKKKEDDDEEVEDEEEVEEGPEKGRENMCTVCGERSIDTVLVPCGHVTCFQCCEGLRSCPTCKIDIKSKVKLFVDM